MPEEEKNGNDKQTHVVAEEVKDNVKDKDKEHEKEPAEPVKPKIFVEESSLATAAVPPVTTVNRESIAAFFDPKTCSSTEQERVAQFQKVHQKHLAAVEVVVRPTMSKAEEAAKQADIRHSFQVSAAAVEKTGDPSSSAPAVSSGHSGPAEPALGLSSSPPASLEQELEKLMDEEETLLESTKPTKSRAPKAKSKPQDGSGPEKVEAGADSKAKPKAKITGKAANFQSSGSGKGKGGRSGSGSRGRGNGNNFKKQQK